MKRGLGLLVVLAACDSGGTNGLPPPVDVQATWRVRCTAPNEPCDYPVRQLVASIGPVDPEHRHAQCGLYDGILNVSIGRSSVTDADGNEPGYALQLFLGYDPVTGFDLPSQCVVNVAEGNGREWWAECLDAAPAPGFACQLEAPTLVDGALALRLRCEAMGSSPFQVGRDADLGGGSDASAPINLQISPCDVGN